MVRFCNPLLVGLVSTLGPVSQSPGPYPSTSLEFSSQALCLVYTGIQRLAAPNSQSTGFLQLLFTMLSYT